MWWKKADRLNDLTKAIADEVVSLRFLVARNELYQLRLLAKVALGTVLTPEDLLKTMAEAKLEMSFEDVKANVMAEIQR